MWYWDMPQYPTLKVLCQVKETNTKNGTLSDSIHNEEAEAIIKEMKCVSKYIVSFSVNKNIL